MLSRQNNAEMVPLFKTFFSTTYESDWTAGCAYTSSFVRSIVVYSI